MINTHKGLYRPTHLPFGVSSMSPIFQLKLSKYSGVYQWFLCRVDNILILQRNDQEHLVHLNEVLARLESSDLRLKLSKCKFMQLTVEHLGYQIDGEENSPILVQKEISPSQGSQAIKHIAGTEKRYPNSRSRTITKMGLSACCIPI